MHSRLCHPANRLVALLTMFAVLAGACLGAAGCRRPHPQAIDLSSSVAEAAGVGNPGPAQAIDSQTAPIAPPPVEVFVYVSGAAATPGVYRLVEGARACDALAAAGGPRSDAHLDHINLAAVVSDGQHVHIPSRAEVAAETVASGGGSQGAAAPRAAGPVNINKASANQLLALPGIGPVLAGRIVAYRAANGPFAKIDDLLSVQGIGPAKLADLRPFATAGP
jgi:competence protein ComEA